MHEVANETGKLAQTVEDLMKDLTNDSESG